jgi:hypothetical protein
MALAAVALLLFGVETRNRRLEQITAATFAAPMGGPSPAKVRVDK